GDLMRPSGHLPWTAPASTAALAAIVGCGSSPATPTSTDAGVSAHWRPALHVTRVVDLTPPRAEGRLVVATHGRLALLHPGSRVVPFARGRGGHPTAPP